MKSSRTSPVPSWLACALVPAALVAPTLAFAQVQAQAPAAKPWAAAALFPASSLKLSTLPNGVRVLTRATSGTGLVCVQVWVRAGSRFESNAQSGSAHVIESAALRASRGYPRAASTLEGGAAHAIESLGGQPGSQTSRDATFYSATVAAMYLPQALRALADAVLRPDLSDSAIEEAKSNVLLEQQERESNPLVAVSDLAYRAAFSKHPYAKPAGGASLSVETLAPVTVRGYHQKMYVGRSLSVVIVGDFDPKIAHRLAAQSFAAAPAAPPPRLSIASEVEPHEFASVVRKRPINRSALALAFAAPPVSKAEDVVPMDVLLSLWREGSRATLRAALLTPRDQKPAAEPPADPPEAGAEPTGEPPLALAYDVDYLTQRDASLFIVTMALEPSDQSDAVAAVLREVGRVQDGGVSAEELARAKSLLSSQFTAQSESVSGQASSLGFYDMIGSYEFALKYLPRVQRVTLGDLQRVARTYFSRTKYLQAVIEPLPPERVPNGNSPVITAQAPLSNSRRGRTF